MGFFRELRKGRIGKFGNSIETIYQKIGCYIHFYYFDHGWIRSIYSNYYIVDDRLHRSGQPSYAVLKRAKRLGVMQLISFRNPGKVSYQLFKEKWANDLGLKLHSTKLSATPIAFPQNYLEILKLIEITEGKTLIHCKSGADRTGLVSAIYILSKSRTSIIEADGMLNWKFGHFGFGKKKINRRFIANLKSCLNNIDQSSFDLSLQKAFELMKKTD